MALSSYRIRVASNTNSITSLLFDPYGPTLNVTSEIVVGFHPRSITGHPSTFTTLEKEDGLLVALTFDDNTGNGTYNSGTIMAAPISALPPYFRGDDVPYVPPRAVLQLNGYGPNHDRQESSHPHQVVTIPERNEILIPDLGADRTWRLAYDGRRGALSVQGSVTYPPGNGPRHAVIHEDVLYTVSELTNNLFAHHLPPLPASPKLLSTTSTLQLQPGEGPADRAVAGLLLSPALKEDACNDEGGARSRPAPFLYATNRYDPSAEGDTVAIFSLNDPAMPTLVAEVHTGLQNLRGAAVGGEDSRWMVLGGMQGGGVEVYERVDGGRSLKEIAALPDIEGPAGFLWLTPRDHGF